MNNIKIPLLISILFLSLFIVGCASTKQSLHKNADVLIANDQLIRFAFLLDDHDSSGINSYASKHCRKINKQAVRGVRTCDGNRCEIAYFCEAVNREKEAQEE